MVTLIFSFSSISAIMLAVSKRTSFSGSSYTTGGGTRCLLCLRPPPYPARRRRRYRSSPSSASNCCGQLQVVLKGALLIVIQPTGRGDGRIRVHGHAHVDVGGDQIGVDGRADGLAHVHVVQRIGGVVQQQRFQLPSVIGNGKGVDAAFILRRRHRAGERRIHAAVLVGGDQILVAGEQRNHDFLNLRLGLPPVVVDLEPDVVGGFKRGDHVRPGAQRVGGYPPARRAPRGR